MRCFLGFDFGLKRIGVATGQEITGTAQALTTITNPQQKPDWVAIEKLINEWKPHALVIGVPYHLDGKVFDMTLAAQKFGRQLNGRFNLPVFEMDERLSSREAEAEIARQRQAGNRKKTQKGDIDKMAAQIILQSWLQQQEHSKNE
ncbi:MAG: Holliday junction resolvase RuvX [Gammaproteobacteria bacterium]|nr:Holliday junction resolvase RuvX [Gammaproteobacteria bacterium]